MSKEKVASQNVTHCSHCGKNLGIIKQKNLVVEGQNIFCCRACGDLHAESLKSSRKGRWSRSRSPFVDLKKVLT